MLEGLAPARAWGFESPLPHQPSLSLASLAATAGEPSAYAKAGIHKKEEARCCQRAPENPGPWTLNRS